MTVLSRLAISNRLLLLMITLQLAWLATIGLTGAATSWDRLLSIALYTIVTGALLHFVPSRVFTKLKGLMDRLIQNEKILILSLVVCVLVVGFGYAYYQRIWTWDEELSFNAARIVATEGLVVFFENYARIEWLGNQHPPLMPIVNGLAMRIFGVDLVVVRLVTLLFGLGSVLLTYFIGRELYGKATGFLAAIMLLTFPLILRLGTTALTDTQVSFFFSLALFLSLLLRRRPSLWLGLLLGIVVGAGLLTKYTMMFTYPVLFAMFVIDKGLRSRILQLGMATLVSGLILTAWILFAREIGVFEVQREVTEVNPGWFVRDTRGLTWMLDSLLTKLPSAIGIYNLPLILLGGILLLGRRNQADLILLMWVVSIAILLVLTIPDHRYFMMTFPALAIIMAFWLSQRSEIAERVVVLALLSGAGALYLFIDWFRASELFFR